jgi:hypothetical protein
MWCERWSLVRLDREGRIDHASGRRSRRLPSRYVTRIRLFHKLHVAIAQPPPDACCWWRLSRGEARWRGDAERVQGRSIHLARDRQTIANLIPGHRDRSLTVVFPICFGVIEAGLL